MICFSRDVSLTQAEDFDTRIAPALQSDETAELKVLDGGTPVWVVRLLTEYEGDDA